MSKKFDRFHTKLAGEFGLFGKDDWRVIAHIRSRLLDKETYPDVNSLIVKTEKQLEILHQQIPELEEALRRKQILKDANPEAPEVKNRFRKIELIKANIRLIKNKINLLKQILEFLKTLTPEKVNILLRPPKPTEIS